MELNCCGGNKTKKNCAATIIPLPFSYVRSRVYQKSHTHYRVNSAWNFASMSPILLDVMLIHFSNYFPFAHFFA